MSNYINNINSVGEWVRLDHQAGLVGKAMGLLPALLDDMEFTRILDVGCGPGRWALDIAANQPETEVTGIDLSTDMMDYANARARTQNLDNVSFIAQDFLTNKLPFSEGSFDLINVRFAVGWLKDGGWLLLLSRCFVLLKPGGDPSSSRRERGITLPHVLLNACRKSCVRHSSQQAMAFLIPLAPWEWSPTWAIFSMKQASTPFTPKSAAWTISYYHEDQEANRAWRDSFHALISESSIFLFQAGVTTVEELAQLDAQISIEMFQEDLGGIGPLLYTSSAQRPAGETIDEQ